MDVIMGDIPLFLHVNTADTIFSIKLLYNLTTLCLKRTLPCVEFMDVTIRDIYHVHSHAVVLYFSIV